MQDDAPRESQEVWSPSDEAMLLVFLHDRDVLCPLCSYNLRGLTVPRCPECGREVRLWVGLTEPYLRAWIALAFVAFGTASIGLLILTGFILRGAPPTRLDLYIGAALAYLMATPLGAIFTVWKRRAFLRLARSSQWGIVAGSFVVTMGAIIVLFNR